MPSGLLIGLIVGTVTALVMLMKQRNRKQKFLQLLNQQGPAAARSQLDRMIPALMNIPMSKILDQKERMAALTLVGDTAALERELAGHKGKLTCVAQVGAIGLLGLAIRGADPGEAARRLDALATRMETEGGMTMKLVKKKVRSLARLAAGIAGEQLSADEVTEIGGMTGNDSPLAGIVIMQGLVRATEAAGGNPQELRAKVREQTTAFETPPTA